MAKQRPSVQKRQREYTKRQREQKKAEKAARKREQRMLRDQQNSPATPDALDLETDAEGEPTDPVE